MRVCVALTLLGLACSTPPRSAVSAVEISGCEELVDRGGELECQLRSDTSEMHLWVPGRVPRVIFDAVVSEPVRARERGDGWSLVVAVPRAARRLTVAGEPAGEPSQEFWMVKLAWDDASGPMEALAPLFAAYHDARDVDCQAVATALSQRAQAEGRWRRALVVATIGSACGIRQGDLAAIARWRGEAERIPAGLDDREIDRANLVAGALIHEGDFHAALTVLEEGIEHALRLDMTTLHAQLLSLYSLAASETGDFSGAMRAAREALDARTHPHLELFEQVALRDNLAWAMLRRAERLGLGAPAEAEEELLRAIAVVDAPSYAGPLEYGATLRLNLAQLFLLAHKLTAADEVLDVVAAEVDSLGPKFQAELRLLRARVRLAVREYDAAHDILGEPGLAGGAFGDQQLELWIARGEIAESRGDLAAARSYYHLAHRSTFERVQGLSATQGLQRFVFDRRRAVQRLVRLLGGPLDDARSALAIAREAVGTDARLLTDRGVVGDERTQCLAAGHTYLAARDSHERELLARWDLTDDQRRHAFARAERATQAHADELLDVGERRRELALRDVRPGELALLYFPLDDDRLLAFAATHDDVAVAPVDARALPLRRDEALDAATLMRWSDALLDPFARMIADARRIRILPSPGLQVLPFHALPWRGRPLLAHAAVEYSLDLPPRSEERRGGGVALVVGDPKGDLAGARVEAEAIGAGLKARGFAVTTLLGRAADGPSVRAALLTADHLHYAGHSETAGERGWESALRLAGSTTLTIADILALERVPRTVSLLSCSAGNVPSEPRAQGVTLAGAFLIAGSDAVIAPSTALHSGDAAAIAAELERSADAADDFPALYRIVMLSLVEVLAPSTWQALRLWVP